MAVPAEFQRFYALLVREPTEKLVDHAAMMLRHHESMVACHIVRALCPIASREDREFALRRGWKHLPTLFFALDAIGQLPVQMLRGTELDPKKLYLDSHWTDAFGAAACLDRAAEELGLRGRPQLPVGPRPLSAAAAPRQLRRVA